MADLNRDLFQQLAKFALGGPTIPGRKPSDYEIALQIMQNSDVNFNDVWSPRLSGNVPKPKVKDGGPGIFGRTIDVLLRPLYASANAFKESGGLSSGVGMLFNLATGNTHDAPERIAKGFQGGLRGLQGKDKTTYSQLIRENEDLPDWMQKGVSGFATGLAADIAGDPLTYIPIVGPAKAGIRLGAKVAGKEVPYIALPKATKKAIKAAKLGTPKPVDFPVSGPVIGANRSAAKAFQATMPAAAGQSPLRILIPELAEQATKSTTPVISDVARTGVSEAITKALAAASKYEPAELFARQALTKSAEQAGDETTKKALEALAKSTDLLNAMKDAPAVNAALEQGAKEAAIAERILSPQQAALHAQTFNNEAKTILRAMEVTPSATKTYTNLAKAITYKSRGPVQNAIDRNANELAIRVAGPTQKAFRSSRGRFLPKNTMVKSFAKPGLSFPTAPKATLKTTQKGVLGPVNKAVSKALAQHAAIPMTVLRPGETLSEQTVVTGIMSRFATHMGQKDLRPLVLIHMGSALARASERTKAMEKAFKGFSEREAIEAWDIARGAKPIGIASSQTVVKLADQLRGQMELFFRSRAIPEAMAKGNSVAMRSGMTLADINKTLARYKVPFAFTAGKAIDPITQAPISYEKGTNWLISWETHAPKNITDLKRFIFGLQSAAEQLTAEYAFLDDIAYRAGSTIKTGAKNVKVVHPRLKDYFFDKDIADQLSTALATMGAAYTPKSPFTRFIRQAVSMWKGGVTIYNPRHHIANVIGDTFLMWMAGINDPTVFAKSAKVLFANAGLYKDLATVDKLVGTNAVKNALAKPGTMVAKNKSGVGVTAQQLYIAAFNGGLLQRSSVIEDIAKEGLPLPGKLAKPFGGKVHNVAAGLAENREHFVKLAHFIGAFEKTRGKDLRQIFEEVTTEVRKWHPDGLDLTKEEQAVRALLVPFYSWMRKSTPLIIEGALMNPNKAFTSYAKVNYNLQSVLGIEGISPSDPYPDDQLFPAWLKDDNVPVLGKTGQGGIAGFLAGLGRQATDDQGKPIDAYTMFGPTNPVQDFFTQFGGFRTFGETKDAALSTLNPGIRIPLELQQGRELYTNIPLKDRKLDYLTNNIPMVNQVARMTNVGPFGPTGRAEKYGTGLQGEQSINWLLGVNLTGTGPYIKSAEFEQLPKKREENKRIREFASDIGYPLKEKGRIPQWIRDLYLQRNGGQ